MSDDFISRRAAIEEMREMYHAAEKWGQEAEDDTMKARAESCMATLVEMKLRVEKLPSAERRGKWELNPNYPPYCKFYRCSSCKKDAAHIITGGELVGCNDPSGETGGHLEFDAEDWKSPYCPNCGAKMESEE